MITLIKIVHNVLKEDFDFFYYFIIISFTAFGIWVNYFVFKIEPAIWDLQYKIPNYLPEYILNLKLVMLILESSQQVLGFLFFYSYLYIFCLLVGELFKKGDFSWLKGEFFFKIFFIFLLLGIVRSLVGKITIEILQFLEVPYQDRTYSNFSLWAVTSALFIFLSLFIFYQFYDSKKHDFSSFYGFLLPKGKQLKIYTFMSYFVIPIAVIFLVIGKETMLEYYPLFERHITKEKDNFLKWLFSLAIFEGGYTIAFVRVELIFRGFLVLSLVKIIGARAILPMALVYCFAHFGKPIEECISSFFGGYLLGAVTLKHHSIIFGIALHVLFAMSLELFSPIVKMLL